jgi:hypothetical protein
MPKRAKDISGHILFSSASTNVSVTIEELLREKDERRGGI